MSRSACFLGSSISAYIGAATLQVRYSFGTVFVDPLRVPPQKRWILVNPATFAILRDYAPDLGAFLQQYGHVVTQHHVHGKARLRHSISFEDTWMIDAGLLKKYIYDVLLSAEAICLGGSREALPVEGSLRIECQGPPRKSRQFGNRQLLSCEVEVTGLPQDESHFATSEFTWFYLSPISSGRMILQLATPTPPQDPEGVFRVLLKSFDFLKLHVKRLVSPSVAVIPIAPSWSSLTVSRDCLLAGEALASYDPVSGYGLTNALRSSALCAAVLKACMRENGIWEDVCSTYSCSILFGFQEHLTACIELYQGLDPRAWDDEVQKMVVGLTALTQPMA